MPCCNARQWLRMMRSPKVPCPAAIQAEQCCNAGGAMMPCFTALLQCRWWWRTMRSPKMPCRATLFRQCHGCLALLPCCNAGGGGGR
eukprot:1160000-Pelagomonas_calceolata.AAC.23